MGLSDDATRRDYFTALWEWFLEKDGARHVAAFLHERDISGFSAALGQRKTDAHREVVRCGMVGDEWAADAIEQCKNQSMVSGSVICYLAQYAARHNDEEAKGLNSKLRHAMPRLGYEVYPNPKTTDGRWKLKNKNKDGEKWHTIYRKRSEPRPTDNRWQEGLDIYF
jgi:hypothetical protein